MCGCGAFFNIPNNKWNINIFSILLSIIAKLALYSTDDDVEK